MGKNDGSGGTFIASVWYIITPIAAYILVSNICQVLLAMLYQKTVSEVTGSLSLFLIAYSGNINIGITMTGAVSGWIAVAATAKREVIRDELRESILPIKRRNMGYLIIAVTGCIALGFALNILFGITGLLANSTVTSDVQQYQYQVSFVPGLIAYGIVMPFIEESIFRSVVYLRLRNFSTVLTSAIVSAALFGVYHMNILQAVYGFIMGLIFAYSYAAFRRFAVPFAMHSLTNILIFTISYFGLFTTMCTYGWFAAFLAIAAMSCVMVFGFRKNS
jgi:hypothetical protein